MIYILRCAVYVRVSTEMDTQKTSIAHQKNFFEKYIREKGWKLYKIYQDVESGITVEKRKGLLELIRDGEKKLFDVLLTKSISRFARNTLEGLYYIREFKRRNIRFITIEDGFDSEEYDEFMFTLLLSMAQKESEKISERIRFGKCERAKKGLYNGSNPPYGYRKKGKDRLVPSNDVTTQVVRFIYKMYIEGWGLYKIAKHLNEKGYPTPSQAANKANSTGIWHQSTVKNILTNKIYIGNMVQNKSRTKDLLMGIREENPKEKYIEVRNTHEGIIEPVVFEEVQKLMKKRASKRKGNGKSLFSNLLFCGECGSGLHYKKNKKAYICGRVNKMGKAYCPGTYVKEELMKQIIEDDLFQTIKKQINLCKLNKKIKDEWQKKYLDSDLSQIDMEIKNMEKKKNRLLEILLDGLIGKGEYRDKKESLENQIKLLQNIKNEIQLKLSKNNDEVLSTYKDLLDFIKFDRICVNKLINRIVVYKWGTVKVYYNFSIK